VKGGTRRRKSEAKIRRADENGLERGRLLKRTFFEDAPERVAPKLLGKVLARRTRSGWVAGRIVEVEAYLGPHHEVADPAAHSYRGPTPRNRVMFGPAGHAYVYSIYGQYYCMNITCEKEGLAGGVLLRALEPVAGMEEMARNRGFDSAAAAGRELTCGPGRLCQALGLTRPEHNGLDLLDASSPLQVWDDGTRVRRVLVTRRIGLTLAVELPLRFAVPGSACVSGPKRMEGKYVVLGRRIVRRAKRLQS